MAELVAVVGALSSFLQVVDFTANFVSLAYGLAKEERGTQRELTEIEQLATQYQSLAQDCIDTAQLVRVKHEFPDIIEASQKCRDATEDILARLKKLKMPKGQSSARKIIDGVRVAAGILSARKDIEARRKTLNELNGVLATCLMKHLWMRDLLPESDKDKFGDPRLSKDSIKNDATDQTGGALDGNIDDPNEQGSDADNKSDPKGKKKSIAQKAEEAKLKKDQENIKHVRFLVERDSISHLLNSLRFDDIDTREAAIAETWGGTYVWALDEPIGFTEWLAKGDGIFWITGKAGSGKSTLLKYLSSASVTTRRLLEWSKGRDIVIAKFFFWYAGSERQKSITGLLMSILHQILFEIPSLGAILFPDVESAQMPIQWTHARLQEAVPKAAELADKKMSTSFCFFVDGLDEYTGNHLELIQLLNDLTRHNVKICTSSRPWTAFRTAFEEHVPNIRVEDFSLQDIRKYTSDKIRTTIQQRERFGGPSSADPEISLLINEIARKAEGVFLWVILVVRSICHGIVEWDDPSRLRLRVQEFPSDLEDFFANILERVDRFYRQQTYQALKLAWLTARAGGTEDESKPAEEHEDMFQDIPVSNRSAVPTSSFLNYYLIRKRHGGLDDPGFAFDEEMLYLDQKQVAEIIEDTRKFLSSSCKDLLSLPRQDRTAGLAVARQKVQFFHRTVYDFLNGNDMQRILDEAVPSYFKDGRVMHLLNLKRLTFYLSNETTQSRVETANDCAAMSLNCFKPHCDMNSRYVAAFARRVKDLSDEVRDAHPMTTRMSLVWTSTPAFATFIAYGQDDLISEFVEGRITIPDIKITQPTASGSHHDPMWLATFGGLSLSPFTIHEVRDDLFRRLIYQQRWDTILMEGNHDCTQNAWQVFLRQWYTARPPASTSPEARAEKWRRIWDMALLFFNQGAELEETFCGVDHQRAKSEAYKHRVIVAKDHVLAHVPHDWLSETLVARRFQKAANAASANSAFQDAVANFRLKQAGWRSQTKPVQQARLESDSGSDGGAFWDVDEGSDDGSIVSGNSIYHEMT